MPGGPLGWGRSGGAAKAPKAAKPHRGGRGRSAGRATGLGPERRDHQSTDGRKAAPKGWGRSTGRLPRSDRVPPPPVPFASLRPHARHYVVTAHHHTRVALPRHKPAPPTLFPLAPIAPALRPDRIPPRPRHPLLPSLRYTHRPASRYFHSTPSLPSDARRVPAAPSGPFAPPPCPSHPAPSAARRPAARRPFRLLPPRIRPASTPFPAPFRRCGAPFFADDVWLSRFFCIFIVG